MRAKPHQCGKWPCKCPTCMFTDAFCLHRQYPSVNLSVSSIHLSLSSPSCKSICLSSLYLLNHLFFQSMRLSLFIKLPQLHRMPICSNFSVLSLSLSPSHFLGLSLFALVQNTALVFNGTEDIILSWIGKRPNTQK